MSDGTHRLMSKGTLVTATASAVTLVGSIAAAVFMLEARYAHSADVKRLEQDTVQTIHGLRCDIMLENLNELEAKDRLSLLTEYDKVRRTRLKAQWERYCIERGTPVTSEP